VDDIRKMALPALRHRIILNFEAEAEGLTTDAVIENILATLPVRVE
jgi:MoxR-like ATPase